MSLGKPVPMPVAASAGPAPVLARPRSLPSSLPLAAAVATLLVCCALPGDHPPFWAIGLSSLVAVALLLSVGQVFRKPAPGLALSLLALVAGAALGASTAVARAEGDWSLLLGGLQLVGGGEALVRFAVAFLAIGLLGVLCSDPRGARALGMLAVSGPALLLLYQARGLVEARWPEAAAWQTSTGLLGGFGLLVVVWGLVLGRLEPVETLRAALGRRAVRGALRLPVSPARGDLLAGVDPWLDPLRSCESQVRGLVDAKGPVERQRAFKRLLADAQVRPLSHRCRETLEARPDHPEGELLLAEDDLLRGRVTDGVLRLMGLLDELSSDAGWLVDAVWEAWARVRPAINPTVQAELWRLAAEAGPRERPAFAALILSALQGGLAPGLADAPGEAGGRGAELEICSALRGRAPQAGEAAVLLSLLRRLPELIARRELLPRLREVAAATEAGRTGFFRERDRPQLLEALEAPPTSIYGHRIACWTFAGEGGARRPEVFAVTGHGPGPVCARVSSILFDLASERNCPADLLLAGFSWFEGEGAAPARPQAAWTVEKLEQRVRRLAARLRVEDLASGEELSGLLARMMGSALRTGFDSALEEVLRLEAETGFVRHEERDAGSRRAALEALSRGTAPAVDRSLPVLVPYRHAAEPLRVRLPLLCTGLEEYQRVADEYRRSVHEEIRREWERRRRKYEEWAGQLSARWRHLLSEVRRGGPGLLLSRIVYIGFEIDPATATEIPLDPPRPITELEYFQRLPLMILQQLAYWAWAQFRIEALPEDQETPHTWERGCLLDAFLRGWPLPLENERLDALRKAWEEEWRPTALLALDAELRARGLALRDIAVENTIFRLLDEEDDSLTLEVWHVWDPFFDPLPHADRGWTQFSPAFGERRTVEVPAREAQEDALAELRRSLASGAPPELSSLLLRDSGAALDAFLESVCAGLRKSALDEDLARIRDEAARRLDPLARFGFQEKLTRSDTYPSVVALARSCAEAWAGDPAAVPDFLAWSLYLAGRVIVDAGRSLRDPRRELFGERRLPDGIDRICLQNLEGFGPWGAVQSLVEGGPCSATFRTLWEAFGEGWKIAQVRHVFDAFRQRFPDYWQQCRSVDGPPPVSEQRERESTPGCFRGWDRICCDLAEGDTALDLAWALREGARLRDAEGLARVCLDLGAFPVSPACPLVTDRRRELLEELQKLRNAADAVAWRQAREAVGQALAELFRIAEGAYERAAVRDPEHGCGWLRLARLLFLTARFRGALSLLLGPPPRPDLDSCQLPLGLAVRLAGGSLVTESGAEPWAGPGAGSLVLSCPLAGGLSVELVADGAVLGRCTVVGLAAPDLRLLEELFAKYEPGMLRSAGRESFDLWLRLVQVPGLGARGALARAAQGEAEAALLAAAVSFGPPADLLPPGTAPEPRPAAWLDQNVVTELIWRSR